MNEHKPRAHTTHSHPIVDRVNTTFDSAVVTVNLLLPDMYHPYFLMEDIAALSFVAIGFAFQCEFGHLNAWTHALSITLTFALYQTVYLKWKRRLTGVGARSFMQDSLFFALPIYLGLSWAFDQPLAPALDVLALSLLLAVGFIRIGCFFGGCCHGKPCGVGVRYRAGLLRSVDGARMFSPGVYTGERVFPIQLVCSAGAFLIVGLLWIRLGSLPAPDGSTMPLAVLAYSSLRFVLEFFRGHRHRPMYAGLSEAQWLSLVLIALAVGNLCM